MKKILLFLLFFLSMSFAMEAQITTPSDYEVCDDNNDGFAIFDLSIKTAEILNGENPNNYIITYHENVTDASSDIFSIGTNYANLIPFIQTLYVRIENITMGTFSVVDFDLMVSVAPTIIQPNDLTIYQNPYVGTATFNLTSQNDYMAAGVAGYNFSFYLTQFDAMAGTAQLPTPSAYANSSPMQTIWVRITNGSSGCFTIADFDIIVLAGGPNDIVYIPDVNFKAKLLAADVNNQIAMYFTTPMKIDANSDGEIQFSEALSINYLDVRNSNISDMTGIEAFINLDNLTCSENQLTSIDVSALSNLYGFYCENNSLTNINLSGGYLTYFYCQNNQLTSLDLSAHMGLSVLDCSDNNITSIQFPVSSLLTELRCNSNPITSLDLSPFVFLMSLHCTNTLITTLDCNSSTSLVSLYIHSNSLLETVLLKNGSDESFDMDPGSWLENWNSLPSLQYVCADENQVASIQALIPAGTASVSSYCTFTSGGNFNTINGVATSDANNNGCDPLDLNQPFIKINISDGIENGSVFTSNNGAYEFFTQAGNYTLTSEIENPTYFSVFPSTTTVNFPTVNNSIQTRNFCITPNGIHPDIEIAIAPIVPARPGFPAIYEVVYKNIGNQTLNQQYGISFFYNQNLMNFTLSNPAPETQNAGALNWSVNNLQPFESRSIYVTMNINAPTATNPVNINDVLTLTANAIPATGETNTQNNIFQFNQTVVGSYDPNDKQCVEGDIVSPVKIGEYLHYLIRFENTGNYYAENIVVKDVIDATKFDVSSLQIMSSSHPVEAKVRGNIAEFIFKNINLDSGGHGNILLKLKTKANLTAGTTVSNKADIFFDYNHPIITNFANTTFQELSVPEKNLNQAIKIYPNPADDVVNIKADSTIRSIQVYDVQGRILISKILSEENASVDLSSYSSGIYYLKINSDNGAKTEKLIKK